MSDPAHEAEIAALDAAIDARELAAIDAQIDRFQTHRQTTVAAREMAAIDAEVDQYATHRRSQAAARAQRASRRRQAEKRWKARWRRISGNVPAAQLTLSPQREESWRRSWAAAGRRQTRMGKPVSVSQSTFTH